jgi:glycosyltransferase involved in cell wall biosynthesis
MALSPATPAVEPARPPVAPRAGLPRVGLVAHTPFWMFDQGRELRRRGWDVSLFTATPGWMVDAAVATRVHVRLRWATWSQALRRLARHGLYVPDAWFWEMERRARPDLARWVARHLDGLAIVDALSSWGADLAPAIHRGGARYVCSRGSSHIQFQQEILEDEFARWSCPAPPRFPRWLVERELEEYAAADAIAVPSQFVLRTFLERGVPAAKLHRCPYGVDLRRFSPRPRADARFRVLFVGSASIRKGIGYLLEAVRPLVRAKRLELWLVGAVASDARPLLARHADLFVRQGFVAPERLADVYSQGSVLVLPSVEEGLGRVQAQAMACGLPVIATRNTGVEDLLTDGREGFIVPIRDGAAIRDRLEWMLDHPAEREAMGAAALRRVASLGGWADYGALIERMYLGLFGAPARGAAARPAPGDRGHAAV